MNQRESFVDKMSLPSAGDEVWLDESALLRLQLWTLAEAKGQIRKSKAFKTLPAALLTTASWSAPAEEAALMGSFLTTGATLEGVKVKSSLLLTFRDGVGGSVKAALGEKWGERVTRACQGSCGAFQIAPAISASRFTFESGDEGPHTDIARRYTALKSASASRKAKQFSKAAGKRLINFASALLNELLKAASQMDVRLRINRLAKALKTCWLASIGPRNGPQKIKKVWCSSWF